MSVNGAIIAMKINAHARMAASMSIAGSVFDENQPNFQSSRSTSHQIEVIKEPKSDCREGRPQVFGRKGRIFRFRCTNSATSQCPF